MSLKKVRGYFRETYLDLVHEASHSFALEGGDEKEDNLSLLGGANMSYTEITTISGILDLIQQLHHHKLC